MREFNEELQQKKLTEIRHNEGEDLAEILSKKYGHPYTDFSVVPINTEALTLIPEEAARGAKVAAFGIKANTVDVGILTPNNERLEAVMEMLRNKKFVPNIFMVSEDSLEKAWSRYKEISHAEVSEVGVIDVNEVELTRLLEEIRSVDDMKHSIEEGTKTKNLRSISKVLEIMIAGALATDASDIHLEPEKEQVRLRLRLDGVLQHIAYFDNHVYQLSLSRINIVSGLKLNIKKQAQDGRFSIRAGKDQIEIRTSIIPGSFGESIVLRILNPKAVALELPSLGVDDGLLKVLEREISKPHGMILNTGPTGSGKTTTLYSFLKRVNEPGIKIITIEDPVEYRLPGVIQTQVRKGYSFGDGLRAILRQDPDIIMVGEIRDVETAKIAINASLTGHMVFSTLHTNTAAGAIPRLLDLGVDIKVLGDALTVTMAQRLVRKLCMKCKQEYAPNSEERAVVDRIVAGLPEAYKKDAPREEYKLWKAPGCPACNGTGYKGREGLYEAVLMDESVVAVVLQSPTEHDIWKASRAQGILRMREHGILKVLRGLTSLDEVERVVDLREE